jgi:hypothetical protein
VNNAYCEARACVHHGVLTTTQIVLRNCLPLKLSLDGDHFPLEVSVDLYARIAVNHPLRDATLLKRSAAEVAAFVVDDVSMRYLREAEIRRRRVARPLTPIDKQSQVGVSLKAKP